MICRSDQKHLSQHSWAPSQLNRCRKLNWVMLQAGIVRATGGKAAVPARGVGCAFERRVARRQPIVAQGSNCMWLVAWGCGQPPQSADCAPPRSRHRFKLTASPPPPVRHRRRPALKR
jgi:hypothetical protein